MEFFKWKEGNLFLKFLHCRSIKIIPVPLFLHFSLSTCLQAPIIRFHEYKIWRDQGVAFELREDASYEITNRSLASGLVVTKVKIRYVFLIRFIQTMLSTFSVGGNRRKPMTFGRALTNSFKKFQLKQE